MNRNNLYVLALILIVTLGVAYVSKTKGGIDKIFSSNTSESWMKNDPGWENIPKVDSTPVPQTPATPPANPPAQPQQQKPQQPQQHRLHRRPQQPPMQQPPMQQPPMQQPPMQQPPMQQPPMQRN